MGLEGHRQRTEGAADDVLVQVNRNWCRTIEPVSRRPRRQRRVALNAPRYPPWRDRQDTG